MEKKAVFQATPTPSLVILLSALCVLALVGPVASVEYSPVVKITDTPDTYEENIAWSPDGQKLAFDIIKNNMYSGAYRVDFDGTDYVELDSSGELPAWSPDGSKIACLSLRSNYLAHWIMNADGSGKTQLTFNPDDAKYPNEWSPDGSLLLFASQRTGRQEVYTVDVVTKEIKQLTTEGGMMPDWSPDGSKIIYATPFALRVDIWVMNSDGSGKIQLTSDGHCWNPSWSPDGQKIIFNRIIRNFPPNDDIYEIWTMNPDGSNQQHIADALNDELPKNPYSYDGKYIAFTQYPYSNFVRSLWVMRNDGEDLMEISVPNASDYTAALHPAWCSFDYRLAFCTNGDIAYATVKQTPPKVTATIEIDPCALNLRSEGKWITAYVQLPEGYSPADIVASTVLLNDTISPVLDSKYGFVKKANGYLVGRNGDGILERMLKFDRASVASLICQGGGMRREVSISVTGELEDGTMFEGIVAVFALAWNNRSSSKR